MAPKRDFDWKHSKLYGDWSLEIDLPSGQVVARISKSDLRRSDTDYWVTIQIKGKEGPNSSLIVKRYQDTHAAFSYTNKAVIELLADIIWRLGTPEDFGSILGRLFSEG